MIGNVKLHGSAVASTSHRQSLDQTKCALTESRIPHPRKRAKKCHTTLWECTATKRSENRKRLGMLSTNWPPKLPEAKSNSESEAYGTCQPIREFNCLGIFSKFTNRNFTIVLKYLLIVSFFIRKIIFLSKVLDTVKRLDILRSSIRNGDMCTLSSKHVLL